MDFNASITQAAAKAMEHLTDFVFVALGNLTLARRDAYLNHVKNGIKPDTLATLRTGPLHIATLFSDAVIKRPEEEIAYYDSKGQSASSSSRVKGWYHPYERSDKRSEGRSESKQERPAWKNIEDSLEETRARTQTSLHDLPRANSHINNNHVTDRCQERLLAGSTPTELTMNTILHQNVNLHVVKVVPFAPWHFQKRELSPACQNVIYERSQIKICEKCFLCHSIVLCKSFNKCLKCCSKSACGGPTSKLLENLAGSGCRSESSSNPERGLHPPLSDPAKTHKVSHSHKLLCQSPQEPLPAGGITSAYRQKHNKASVEPNIFELFQLAIFSPKTQQQMETYTTPE